MINLYVMNVSPFEDSSLFSKGLSLIDKERQAKVNNLKKQDVKNLSLGAGLLLLFGLNYASEQAVSYDGQKREGLYAEFEVKELIEHLSMTENIEAFQYSYGPHGKPYVEGEQPICFSLSHSGEYVLLAVSDKEIGADIQQKKEVPLDKLARQVMTAKEYEQWNVETVELQKELFYQIWAGKEAYLKLTGEGMTAGFQTVYYEESKQSMVDARCPEKEIATTWGSLEGYQIAVCQYKENIV